jgi:16S rRNA (cytosine967-C5)-methyltransferase
VLRVNRRHGAAADYLARLAAAGIAATFAGGDAVVLATPCPVQQLPGFAAGDVSVQDSAAQRAAPLLLGAGLPPGARVLDACAAPGGKTAHLLELAELEVLALDSDAARLDRVRDTLERLGLQAQLRAADAAQPEAWWDGRPFDAILLDAPCSASGIVRRHPDVRWLRRAADIPALAATQARLLDALWPTLAVGGRLLYATCSVFRAEGQGQIDAFLQRHGDARVPGDPPSPGHLLPLPDNEPDRPAPAHSATPDGFFYSLLEKT